MPVPNGKIETNSFKKQKKWSLLGILSKKKKIKKSQESMDFCPYDGKINQKVAQNNHLERSNNSLIQQYTCSPRLIRRCNSMQYTSQVSAYSNITSQSTLNAWKSSQQSVYSSSSSACYSDVGAYKSYENSHQSSYYKDKKNKPTSPILRSVPYRCSSEVGYYQHKTYHNQRYPKSSVKPIKLIGKKIPPPPPPRDPNIKAVYYIKNNRLMLRELDSTYFSQGSDDNIAGEDKHNGYYVKEPPRSRRPIQICDVETLSTESENSEPRIQSVEEALQELEDIYNSLGLSDEDLLDRAERRDLPTLHQNMRYQSSDEVDYMTFRRILPKTRRSGVPDIVTDDMAYRRLNKRESKRQNYSPGSFLLVMPTVYNLDKSPRPTGEPDITLDDVVFRSRRQNNNYLKISDPQPPFGIPLGPIVGAAPSDYLHAIPEGRYKPSFHPRKTPDTVEDDLAFRTLRKDTKYNTSCINVSFVHRNRIKINDVIPKLDNNRIKSDTHWIIKKTPGGRSTKNNQIKLLFNNTIDSDADNRQNLMVVKIDHHKPIMLSGFTIDEANQLSKSFLRTNLLQHEPHKICLTNNTHKSNSTQQLKYNYPLNVLSKPYVNSLPVALKYSESYHANNNFNKGKHTKKKFNTRNALLNEFDNNGLIYTEIDGKSQSNFRELIKREYAHRYPLTENQSNKHFVQSNLNCVAAPCNEYVENEMKPRFINNGNTSTVNSITVITTTSTLKSKAEGQHVNDDQLFKPTTSANASEDLIEITTESRKDSSSMLTTHSSIEYGNRVPGYLEVCLYIIIYIYQLFSVNAYSTYIALIFLVALHFCRRLS